LKEECVWQHNFAGFDEARSTIREWIGWYNGERPHQALGYLSPAAFRQKQRLQVV
jgi:putative transposase